MTIRTMREYARWQLGLLLRKVVFELYRGPKAPGSEAIHDLRVSIRRFLQVSRVFQQFLPEKKLKAVRKQLKAVLDLAADVRERDIALEFFDAAGIPSDAAPRKQLTIQRRKAQRRLAGLLRKWGRKEHAARWRSDLELSAK